MSNVATQTSLRAAIPTSDTLLGKVARLLTPEELKEGLEFPSIDDDSGLPASNQLNIVFFLERFGITLRYDEFSMKTYVFGVPGHEVLNDAAYQDIYTALNYFGMRPAQNWLHTILSSYSRFLKQHPVREKLNHLEHTWDGEARLDKWLIDICGVEDTPYARQIAAKWMIAAVRRVRDPGCKFDVILVFEGLQGIGKSSILRALAYDHWFTDNLTIGLEPKEVIELTNGRWVCELPELSNIGKRDVENVKTFLSRQADEARLAYERSTTQVKRQFVLAATTNRSQYLRDESGARRFWVIETRGVIDQIGLPKMLDVKGLEAIRDQLWAEAATRETAGEAIFLDPEVEVFARAEQSKRYELDERQQLLEDLLENKVGFVPNDELYAALGLERGLGAPPPISKLIKGAATRLGWSSARRSVGSPSQQLRGWKSPDLPDDIDDVLEFRLNELVSVRPKSYRENKI